MKLIKLRTMEMDEIRERKKILPDPVEEGNYLNAHKTDINIDKSSNENDVMALVVEKDAPVTQVEGKRKLNNVGNEASLSPSGVEEEDMPKVKEAEQKEVNAEDGRNFDTTSGGNLEEETVKIQQEGELDATKSIAIFEKIDEIENGEISGHLSEAEGDNADSGATNKNLGDVHRKAEEEPVLVETEVPGIEASRSLSSESTSSNSEGPGSVWPEKAVALTHFVRQKSLAAVSSFLHRLSGKGDDKQDHSRENVYAQEDMEALTLPIPMKGRIFLYTRLGCPKSRVVRRYLHQKRLGYVEINIDIYPSRKVELEKIAGSTAVPIVLFNEVLIGGFNDLKFLEESRKFGEQLDYVINETPSCEAPLSPLSGEDDPMSSGTIDELALITRKMKGSIPVKDRFSKMRWFTNTFLGSDAVEFLSEDQYLEREEAVEFGRKMANKLFFQSVEDIIFDDGNNLYRFLDDDPFVSECQNIRRGISELKPKPITEISSMLALLYKAILEAYASEDGKHVDYRSIHGSEEFARYLRVVEELQRVDLHAMRREEKLSFFINLYNMMAIHAILWRHYPSTALDRRKFFGEFKYVIGGSPYSLSAIQNGILRGNQRPAYNLTKPFGANDRRLKIALGHTEPLIHFALACGTRSGPALRCYSPGNIDKELVEAACSFLTRGGLYIDLVAAVAYVSPILKWFSVDFGKNETDVLKHAANYLEPPDSQAFLEFVSTKQLKVIYQPFDWGLNH